MLRFISRQNHEYGFCWRVLHKVRLNPSYLLTSFSKNCSCELYDYLPFFSLCLLFVLSFISILLILCFTRPLFLLSWCHDLKTRCDPNRHIESYYIFDLSISMFCGISCPHLLKFRAIPHVPRNISTTYQFVSTKYSRNKTDMRVNIHYEIALLRYNTLKKFWGKNLRDWGYTPHSHLQLLTLVTHSMG